MARKVPTWSLEKVRSSLHGEINEFRKLALDPRCQWAPEILELMLELQTLANTEPLDADKLQDFVARAHAHIVARRVKGFGPVVWMAEDLIWHANYPPA